MVSEDHSLGRHVSQRSHRTDRSREKPEPGARGPGARSPRRARERERPGSSRRPGKEGEAAGRSAACAGERPGPECASPRWGGGAESERATPRPGRRRLAAVEGSGGGPQGESARRRPTRPLRPRPLCGERDRDRLDSRRVKGKECTRSEGCGGGLGDRGGATPRGVELVESEGRCESSGCRVLGAGRRRPSPRRTEERSWARE